MSVDSVPPAMQIGRRSDGWPGVLTEAEAAKHGVIAQLAFELLPGSKCRSQFIDRIERADL